MIEDARQDIVALFTSSDAGLLSLSDTAVEQIGQLNEVKQAELAEGFGHLYGKVLNFIITVQYQSFVHRDQVKLLAMLMQGELMLSICGHGFRVKICSSTFQWTILSICPPERMKGFEIVKMSPAVDAI